MARRVDDGVARSRRSKRNLGRVDCDILLLLFDQCIEQESEFKLHPLGRTGLFYIFDFALGKRTCVVQDPANER